MRRARSKTSSSNDSAIPIADPDAKPVIVKVPNKTGSIAGPTDDDHITMVDNSSTIPSRVTKDRLTLQECFIFHDVDMVESPSRIFPAFPWGRQLAEIKQEFPK